MERNELMTERAAESVMICTGVEATIFPTGYIAVTLKSGNGLAAKYTLPAEMAGQFTVGASYRVILPGVSV